MSQQIKFYRVEIPQATFGFQCQGGKVITTSPMNQFQQGWSEKATLDYWKKRNAKIFQQTDSGWKEI